MPIVRPTSAEELAALLAASSAAKRSIALVGNDTKFMMGGPALAADVVMSVAGLAGVLDYEPRDLTISVEAGMKFSDLQRLLAQNGQMIALDPPFYSRATVGGVVASNSSGPLRKAYGTARDLIIGMRFATLEGKCVSVGGMVVKNVAGLDMGKLLIGSFGTLAAITSVNFRLHSLPAGTRTFLFAHPRLEEALERRDSILRGPLQPLSLDLLSPATAAGFSQRGYLLALRAAGSASVLNRYQAELSGAEVLTGDDCAAFWDQIREFAPEFLRREQEGVIVRISTTLQGMLALWRKLPGIALGRAAAGVTYACLPAWPDAAKVLETARLNLWPAVVEFAPQAVRGDNQIWYPGESPAQTAAFAMMEKVKRMFDPDLLLGKRRLFGRI